MANSEAKAAAPSGYIVSPLYDCVFFLYAPLLALALAAALSGTSPFQDQVTLFGREVYPNTVFIGTFIAAHLVIVFVRSHGNKKIFSRHRWRFTLVPALLFVAIYSSLWLAVAVSVVAVWWDVYHSSMQTFGLGRIYDMRAGNDLEVGRNLDKALNHLLYIGPILGGAALVPHLESFDGFERVGSVFFTQIPARVESHVSLLTWGVLAIGTPFLGYYVYAYWRLAQKGYKVSPQKVFLLATTGCVSIYTWGFNSFGEAFFIMNFFHAWQYFAIIWWSEGKSIRGLLRVKDLGIGKPVALALLVGVSFGYGFLVTAVPMQATDALFCVALVVSIMHFWYDGFIWSVRKKQVEQG